MTRNRVLLFVLGLVAVTAIGLSFGLNDSRGAPDLVWGVQGVMPGDVSRPRAIAIDHRSGHLFVVDFTARIQMYDLDGHYLERTWTTPDFRNGRPSGLGIDRDGNLLVADSHYHCVRVYDHAGKILRQLGGEKGTAPGQFGYLSDCVQDADGFYYVSEFGAIDRITKLDSDGKVVAVFGEPGQGPLQFSRVRALALGPDGLLYVADACNHRIQVLTRDGAFVREFGTAGQQPGELNLPYDLSFGPGGELYVIERGNQRIQKFDSNTGQSLGTWGTGGSGPGQFAEPWALAVDRYGRVHVIDTRNHRVQRFRF